MISHDARIAGSALSSSSCNRRARHGARVRRRNDRRARAEAGGARSAHRSARGRRALGVAGAGSDRAEPAMRRSGQALGYHSTHGGAHGTARACVDGIIGARTTRSAALSRHDDSLTAWRSLGVARAGSNRAEQAKKRVGQAW